jgi:hypothetical protein
VPHDGVKGVLNSHLYIVSLLGDLDEAGAGRLIMRGQDKQEFRHASALGRGYVANT